MMFPYFVECDKESHSMRFLDIEGIDMGKVIWVMRIKSKNIDLEHSELFSLFSLTHLLLLVVHLTAHCGFGIFVAAYA